MATEMGSKISKWKELIRIYSSNYNLDPYIVAGLIYQESSGNQYAIRPEPGFWKRYAQGIKNLVAGTTNTYDDKWYSYPDLASASYGLCQILYVTALENGAVLKFPTELFDPGININLCCKILRKSLDKNNGSYELALLRYNGGGDQLYPRRVIGKADALRTEIAFT